MVVYSNCYGVIFLCKVFLIVYCMKLIRFGDTGFELPGVQLDHLKYDVSSFVKDYDEAFFAGDGLDRLKKVVDNNLKDLPIVSDEFRIASPIARPSKIICVGLNYRDHAKEAGADIPKEPILFFKSTTSMIGPYDNIVLPKGSVKTDWEVELAVVISKKASYVSEDEASAYIAGYVLLNDVSEREYQLERGGTWDKGKGCDTFAPLGPWLATKDEIEDVGNLDIWLKLNGELVQNSNTRNLIFNVNFLISYISRFMTLLPGDIISTGTPSGVGLGFNPPKYLRSGDVLELGITGLGVSRQMVV